MQQQQRHATPRHATPSAPVAAARLADELMHQQQVRAADPAAGREAADPAAGDVIQDLLTEDIVRIFQDATPGTKQEMLKMVSAGLL
jgi:hypothetical protein